jgi:hypothetical protein
MDPRDLLVDSATYFIEVQCSGLVLDVDAKLTDEGTPIIQYHRTNASNQQWILHKDVDTGAYTFQACHSNQFLSLPLDQVHESKASLHQYTQHSRGQLWKIEHVQADEVHFKHYFKIKSWDSDMYITIPYDGVKKAASRLVQQQNIGKNTQHFSFLPVPREFLEPRHLSQLIATKLHPQISLDALSSSSLDIKTPITTTKLSPAAPVKVPTSSLNFVAPTAAAKPTASSLLPSPLVPNSIYFIRPRSAPNQVLDVFKASFAAGTEVILFDFRGRPNQQWRLTETIVAGSAPTFLWEVQHSSMVLGVDPKSGSLVQQQMDKRIPGQKWLMEPRELLDGCQYYSICNLQSGMALTVKDKRVQQEPYAALHSQQFRFELRV